jgi:TolB-like protein
VERISTSVLPSDDVRIVAGRDRPEKGITTRAVLAIGLFALVAVGLSVWPVPALSRPTNASPPIHSIAVLPLANLSGDPAQDYFADAMTDELIADLAKVGSLRVTSRTTIALYKHTSKKLSEIARELNVDAVVEGSIVRSGQRLVTASELGVVSLGIHGTLIAELFSEFRTQLSAHLFGDRSRHIALQLQGVPKIPVIGFRPKMLVRRSANKLCRPRPSVERRIPLKTRLEEIRASRPPTRVWRRLTFAWRYMGKEEFQLLKRLGR